MTRRVSQILCFPAAAPARARRQPGSRIKQPSATRISANGQRPVAPSASFLPGRRRCRRPAPGQTASPNPARPSISAWLPSFGEGMAGCEGAIYPRIARLMLGLIYFAIPAKAGIQGHTTTWRVVLDRFAGMTRGDGGVTLLRVSVGLPSRDKAPPSTRRFSSARQALRLARKSPAIHQRSISRRSSPRAGPGAMPSSIASCARSGKRGGVQSARATRSRQPASRADSSPAQASRLRSRKASAVSS